MNNGNDDESWRELIKDIDKTPASDKYVFQRRVTLTVTPKISPDKVYAGAPLGELAIGNTDNLDAATAKKLKRGGFAVEAELDLHGYTEDRAFEAVTGFIKESYLKGRRCVAIITGKGLHQNDEDDIFAARGVLKNRVPQWLNLPDIRPLILSVFHPEHREGGSGAVRILLRRRRNRKKTPVF